MSGSLRHRKSILVSGGAPGSGSLAALIATLEALPLGAMLLDPAGFITHANGVLECGLGLERESLAGTEAAALASPESRQALLALIERMALRRTENRGLELRLRTGDGGFRWFCAFGARGPEAGAPLLLQLVDTDAKKRAELALMQSESRLNFALDGAGQGVWDHDLIREKAYFSRAWRQMRGFGPDEDVDAELGPWIERLHPDDRDQIQATTVRQNSGEIPLNAFEYRERHRDGHWMWILSRGRPVEWLPDGRVARIVGTDTDITALKTIESQLAEEKERLKITLQSIADGMISTDASGRITFLNPAAAEITGIRLSEAIGRPVDEVLALRNGEADLLGSRSVAECVAKARALSLPEDTLLAGRSGTPRFVQCSISPVKTVGAGVMGTVLVFRDTTESQRLRAELAHSATHDPLTGLPNRAAFEKALAFAAGTARHESREHSLCYLDLDKFKEINDGAGHEAGDEALKRVAEVLRANCRTNDVAARVGGDEFVVLLTDCPLQSGERVARKLVKAIAALCFSFGQNDYRLGVSIGVTAVTTPPVSKASITREADRACYAAKSGGGGRVVIYSPDLD